MGLGIPKSGGASVSSTWTPTTSDAKADTHRSLSAIEIIKFSSAVADVNVERDYSLRNRHGGRYGDVAYITHLLTELSDAFCVNDLKRFHSLNHLWGGG